MTHRFLIFRGNDLPLFIVTAGDKSLRAQLSSVTIVVSMLLNPDHQNFLTLARSSLLAAMLIFLVAHSAAAQTPRSTPFPDPSLTGRDGKDKEDDPYGSPEAEMRAKLLIKEEKKRYDEHVERAREVFQLASQVNKSFETRKAFSPDDQKKLERLEKLTKRIRNDAGGSDSDNDIDLKDIPATLGDLLKQVTDWADQLKDLVEKTPRQVVSAAVIDQANKLLGLVQRLRGSNK